MKKKSPAKKNLAAIVYDKNKITRGDIIAAAKKKKKRRHNYDYIWTHS